MGSLMNIIAMIVVILVVCAIGVLAAATVWHFYQFFIALLISAIVVWSFNRTLS